MSETERSGWSGPTDLPAKRWVLLTGSRTVLSAVALLSLVGLTGGLIAAGVVYVGPGSTFASVLSSGMLGALATIVTVTLSINQLILSRVFGAPADLTDRLEGNLDFRRSVEDIAGVDASPNDPGSFLSLVARTLEERAAELERQVERAEDVPEAHRDTAQTLATELVSYAAHLESGEDSESTFEVLALTFGTEYADLMDDVRALQRGAGERLPEAAAGALDDILELLKGIATIRQFFKTLAVQQDLAALSRQLIYTGVPALLVTFYLAQVYAGPGGSPTLPVASLPVVASVATAVVFSPLAVLVSYILRVATVTLYTVSVGSFIPPEERAE
ncbi:hypothetical protein EGH21_07860 [Halomicroarcula sp. F13]|uniref:Uncharacterized protein n=1 Tax=Haloarcula rubra TaxID=2487747 RepID=A0AAW4PP66_9EURY|nr:hypothetical protein [Halomicroarcula rubra]MBX0322941.1 hypothetical protein [Halomicroarcula rubra]